MRVVARIVDRSTAPDDIHPYIRQVFVTPGVQYEVHAVAVFEGSAALLVVDDIDRPTWWPTWLFDNVSSAIPSDWICAFFKEEPSLVIGPDFIARDIESYGAMVTLEAEQVDKFWKRVDGLARKKQADSAEDAP